MNRKSKIGKSALILAALISAITAIAHLSCIYLGPSCYKAQMAPQQILQSAIDETWLAPISTAMVSSLFLVCTIYALSGAGIIRKLPLLRLFTYSIATLCIFRGTAIFPLSFLYPTVLSTSNILVGATWFVSGLLFFFGYRYATNKPTFNS